MVLISVCCVLGLRHFPKPCLLPVSVGMLFLQEVFRVPLMSELPWTGSCVLTPLVSFLHLLGGQPGVHLEPLHWVGSLASSRKTRLERRSGEIGVVAPWIPSTCLPIPSFLLSLLWGLPTLAAPLPPSHCHSVQFSSVARSCLTLCDPKRRTGSRWWRGA